MKNASARALQSMNAELEKPQAQSDPPKPPPLNEDVFMEGQFALREFIQEELKKAVAQIQIEIAASRDEIDRHFKLFQDYQEYKESHTQDVIIKAAKERREHRKPHASAVTDQPSRADALVNASTSPSRPKKEASVTIEEQEAPEEVQKDQSGVALIQEEPPQRPQEPTEKPVQPASDEPIAQEGGEAETAKNAEHPSEPVQPVHQRSKRVSDDREISLYRSLLLHEIRKQGFWQDIARYVGLGHYVPTQAPRGALVDMIGENYFVAIQAFLIITNTISIGYETDVSIKAALKTPREEKPSWINVVNLIYTILFTLELLIRMIAFRLWFWVDPRDWMWNWFDAIIVATSIFTDIVMDTVSFGFVRLLRVLRIARAARIFTLLKLFRELRRMVMMIVAILSTFIWYQVILLMGMFMFSIFVIQGVIDAIDELHYIDANAAAGNATVADLTENLANLEDKFQMDLVRKWYGSLADSMYSLLLASTGGKEWETLREPFAGANFYYTWAFVIYVLFATVIGTNVVTVTFLQQAANLAEPDLIIADEEDKTRSFVKQMVQLYMRLDEERTGRVHIETFRKSLEDERIQAYFAAYDVDVAYVCTLFDIFDQDFNGELTILEFVMGMLKIKGHAYKSDGRVNIHQTNMLSQSFDTLTIALEKADESAAHGKPGKLHKQIRIEGLKEDHGHHDLYPTEPQASK